MTQPNILLVILDDWGLVDVNSTLTPNIYAFGTTGGARTFTRTYSMPICSQSRACMLFGKYGRTLGITEGMNPYSGPQPDADVPTLATLLYDAGYATALIGKWHLGMNPLDTSGLYMGAPEARGFEAWRAGTPENVDDFSNWLRIDDSDITANETTYITQAQVTAGLDWWTGTSGPKYMQVALNAPHGPYNFPPADELGGFMSTAANLARRKYECEIRSADWAFGELMAATEPGTIIAVVGDNGTPQNTPAPGQLASHLKATCYEGGIRVPFAIKSSFPAGTSDRLVHIADIPATLLTLAGITPPSDWDGKHLGLPARTTALSEATLGLADNFDLVRAAMTNRYKLMRKNDDPELLFDLQSDPGELAPLSLTDPANASILTTLRSVLYP